MAHKHAADALARLAIKSADNQAQIAKHCVALLGNQSTGAQRRAARVLRDLAAENPGSPVVIVNAGAISPLVTLLSSGAPEVKEEAAGRALDARVQLAVDAARDRVGPRRPRRRRLGRGAGARHACCC